MTLAEHIYRMILCLYPAKHRQVYKEPMLQHARDLSQAARRRGRWHVAVLCLYLFMDGIVNAGIEHVEAIMTASNGIKPAPWISVLLASLPGLLVVLSRWNSEHLGPLLPILGYLYLGLLLLVLPIMWWHRRQFPVWALLPAGALMWFLTYKAGTELSTQVNSFHILNLNWIGMETGIALLSIVVIAAIFVVLLRGQRLPGSVWLVIGVMLFSNVILATLYSLNVYGGGLFPGMIQYLTSSGIGLLEGLMLVAIGLLAARQHGVLALLVVVGGYSYMLTDTDYLFGYPFREWTGLSAYIATATVLYLVVVPVALLRARTRLGRALAVFVPVVAFHVVRLSVPLLVSQQLITLRPGDVVATINVILSLILAWVLYSYIADARREIQVEDSLEATPLPN
jgi:hypothetical protein